MSITTLVSYLIIKIFTREVDQACGPKCHNQFVWTKNCKWKNNFNLELGPIEYVIFYL